MPGSGGARVTPPTARWLAEPAIRDRFQVTPGKLVYQNGEPVTFTAKASGPSSIPLNEPAGSKAKPQPRSLPTPIGSDF